jgi:hypothetical protein
MDAASCAMATKPDNESGACARGAMLGSLGGFARSAFAPCACLSAASPSMLGIGGSPRKENDGGRFESAR